MGVLGAAVGALGLGVSAYSQVKQAKIANAQAALDYETQVANTNAQVAYENAQIEAANKAAEYNAQVAANNAAVQRAQAADALARGQEAEKKLRQDAEEMKGRQRAAAAASGALVDEGSALDVVANTAMSAEDDALSLRANAAREAWGYDVQASNYDSSAELQRMSKAQAKAVPLFAKQLKPANPYMAAAGGLLTGISSLASRF